MGKGQGRWKKTLRKNEGRGSKKDRRKEINGEINRWERDQ